MPLFDYLIIGLFSIVIFLVGISFAGSGNSMKSFFAAGGSLPWWLSGLSLFMSFFSAGTFVVWGSIAYQYGWVAITIQWMMGLGGFLIGYLIAPAWHRTGILTVGQFVGERFGTNLKRFYSYIFLLLSFVTTGAFLYPVAKLFNVSTGFSIEASIIVLGLIVIAYTTAGGLWAVIVTDVLQFIILFAAVIIVVPLALHEVGGFETFLKKVPDGFFNPTSSEYTYWFLLAFLFYNTIFIGGNWAYVQRFTSVSSPRSARKAAWLFGALYLVSPVLWMLPPMIYRIIHPGLTELAEEGAFLLMCKEVLPSGLLGLMLAGMLFATASSVNTTLNMMSAVFTNDLYGRLSSDSSKTHLMKVARISTIFFGIITILVALIVPAAGGIVEVVISVGAITGAPLFAPTIWALFSKRQTARSILITTLVSLTIHLFFKFISPMLLDFSLDRAQEMLVGVFGPLLLLTVFEFFPVGDPMQVFERMREGSDEASDKSANAYAIRILGYAVVFTGILILALGFGAEVSKGWIIFVGFLIMTIGGGLWRGVKTGRN
ncbi:MAG: Na+:solute symporter [Saprospiraceae bacterium]|nr:Na+:solute symporter [Saprospiraceae bacterium]